MSQGPEGDGVALIFLTLSEMIPDQDQPPDPRSLVDQVCAQAKSRINGEGATVVLRVSGVKDFQTPYARELFSLLSRETLRRLRGHTLVVDLRDASLLNDRLHRLLRDRDAFLIGYDGDYRLFGTFPRHADLVLYAIREGASDEPRIQSSIGLGSTAVMEALRHLTSYGLVERRNGQGLQVRMPQGLSVSGRHPAVSQRPAG